MILGLFLSIGESFKDFESKGQLKRLTNYNLKKYANSFDKVFIFSYANESYPLPKNCQLVPNRYRLHRYLYALLMPLIEYRSMSQCHVIRGLQLTGGIPALFAKLLYGKKFVINYGYDYSTLAKIEGKTLLSFLYRFIEGPILNLADFIIIPSFTIFKKLQSKFKNKVAYLPNGVDTSLFCPSKDRAAKKILEVVFIGRLEKQKNLDSLVKALKVLKTPCNLTFYGQGPKRQELIKLAENLKVPLQIKGPVDYVEVAKILRTSDIFILPSHQEGSPKILLEAMASGCAIVASDIPQITEIIKNGETGIISKPEPEALANAVSQLLDPEIRLNLGQNARKKAVEKFEINKLLSREIAILKSYAK